jgi:nitroreductase
MSVPEGAPRSDTFWIDMSYTEAVRQTWQHRDLHDAAPGYVSLVGYATLAASSHNTQPWKFKLEPSRIEILPDLSRRCPEVDPDDHHLYASLGCAAENLLLAAQAAGLKGHRSFDTADSSVHVDFEAMPRFRSARFEAIPSRQCSRAEYDGAVLPGSQLRLLEEAGRGTGVSVSFLTSGEQKEQVADYVAAGNRAQFENARWAREMKEWIRFNPREAERTGDGLYGKVLGIPNVPRCLGELLMPVAVSAERQNRKDVPHIRSSAAIAVFFSEADDRRHWIEAGRSCQRVALEATALGLRTAFINQPVEVSSLRSQFAAYLGIANQRPDLVLRIGRGPEMPRSLRRPLDQVIVRLERGTPS